MKKRYKVIVNKYDWNNSIKDGKQRQVYFFEFETYIDQSCFHTSEPNVMFNDGKKIFENLIKSIEYLYPTSPYFNIVPRALRLKKHNRTFKYIIN